MEWKKRFANRDKGLISRIHEELIQINSGKKIQLKMGRTKQMFFQRRHTNGQQVPRHRSSGTANQNYKETSLYFIFDEL